MRLILDTHIFLWTILSVDKLPVRARDLTLDPDNELFVSTVSIWEIAIKHALKRGLPDDMPIAAEEALAAAEASGFGLLAIVPSHAIAAGALPQVRHADPFDRMLVAQAKVEPMHLITADGALRSYGEFVITV